MRTVSKPSTSFNTHQVIKKLVAKGLKEGQAEEIVEAILEGRNTDLNQLATKEQLLELKSETRTDFAKVKTDIAELKTEMRTGFAKVKTDIAEVKTDIEKAKLSAILIIGSLIVASTTVIGALIKYFSIH